MRHIWIMCVAMLAVAGTTLAATINVPADYTTIQAAVDAASNGDEILVAPGIYTSTHSAHVVDTMGKAVFIHAVNGPSATVIDGQGQRRGVACHRGETLATTLSGFTVRNCFSPEYDYNENGVIDDWEDSGAGIYCFGSSPTITDCLITNNSTGGDDINPPRGGGGVLCRMNSSPHVRNCVISGNHANYGGGIYANDTDMPFIDSCEIAENTVVDHGAGIYCKGSGTVIANCVIENNFAGKRGGGVWFKEGTASMVGCTLVGNQAVNSGGGVFCDDNGSPIITQCTIEWNISKNNGGGVACRDNGNPILRNCSIRFNMTSSFGGGIYCHTNSPQIEECVISYNMALNGGGIYSDSGSPVIGGSTVCGNNPDQIYGNWKDIGGNHIAELCDEDCNDNGTPDDWDIKTGLSEDCNANGVPDECDLANFATATATFTLGDTEFDDTNNETITLIDAASTSRTYVCKNDYTAADPLEWNAGATATVSAANFKIVVEASTGHNGTISVGVVGGVVTLTQATSGVEGNTVIAHSSGWDALCDVNPPSAFSGGTNGDVDCNANGVPDSCDLESGNSQDVDGSGIPDECECLADVVVDGEVNINDVLVTISSWGTSGPLGDVNYDGIVDVEDLLIVISAWGPCE